MMHRPTFVTFLAVALVLVGGLHYYLWARLFRDTGLPRRTRRLSAWLLGALFLSIPLANVVARWRGPKAWVWVSFTWMGLMFYLFLGLLVGDVLYLVAARGVDGERRTFLRRVLAGAASFVAVTTSAYGVDQALRHLRVVEVEVPLAKLPRSLDGFTIVQISDVHVGTRIGRPFIEGIVARMNALRPDLVAITGDLVDGSVKLLAKAIEPLTRLKSKHGTFFVTGNHEYYAGAVAWCAHLSQIGIRVLRNERVSIADGLDLAGVDDFRSRGLAPGHGPDLGKALAGRDERNELVLLAHQPIHALEAARRGVGLQLSGHTHGGQLWPFSYLVRLQQPFIAGLDKLAGLTIYTSRGTGYWGPPMRLGAPAEITKLVLRSASLS